VRGVWRLSWKHALHNRAQTVILVLCISVTLFLPIATAVLTSGYERQLDSRAESTPLIAGARGNRFDLTLSALYFRESTLPTIPWSEYESLRSGGDCVPVPMHVRHSAHGHPVVGTTPEYFERRGLIAERGTTPFLIGDCVLGAEVATELELDAGDILFSDQKELYDISKPAALKMQVCGVLARTGGPDDHAIFVDTKTGWIIDGLAHGHDDVAEGVDEKLVLGRAEGEVVLSGAFIEYNEVTPENVGSYHFHGESAAMPLSSILIFPRDVKAGTLIKARLNLSRTWQVVSPREVIDDLLSFVFRIKAFLDGYSGILASITALMTVLVLLLSMRVRKREMETLNRIGSSRYTVARLYGSELALVFSASLVLALVGLGTAWLFLPDLLKSL
jgi:putative ABC transport system permease protein